MLLVADVTHVCRGNGTLLMDAESGNDNGYREERSLGKPHQYPAWDTLDTRGSGCPGRNMKFALNRIGKHHSTSRGASMPKKLLLVGLIFALCCGVALAQQRGQGRGGIAGVNASTIMDTA